MKRELVKILLIQFLFLNLNGIAECQEAVVPPDMSRQRQSDIIRFRTVYEEVRCPECGIEFYMKDFREQGPIQKSILAATEEHQQILTQTEEIKSIPLEDIKDRDKLQGVLAGLEKAKIPRGGAAGAVRPSLSKVESIKEPKRGSGIVCPYCGRKFFPKANTLSLLTEEDELDVEMAGEALSEVEKSFSRGVSLEISKDLKQIGYDVFAEPKKAEVPGPTAVTQTATGTPPLPSAQQAAGLTLSREAIQSGTGGLVAGSIGGLQSSTPFGGHVFAPHTVTVVSDYVLGPGDEVVVTLWGAINQTFRLLIDERGMVMFPRVGPISLWGVKFEEAKKLIEEKLSETLTNFKADISLGSLRTIKVFVLGNVNKQGVYTLSSQTNLNYALYLAGGPTKLGTLRNVKLIRDKETKNVDLYNWLFKGDKTQDYKLEAEDTIFIPPIGNVVAIAGNVKRPGIYEISNEVILSEVIDMVGGITPIGALQRIQLERIVSDKGKVVFEVKFKDLEEVRVKLASVVLHNGDLVSILPVPRLRRNFITIMGNVETPGDYQLLPDMTVRDLIKGAGRLLPGTHFGRAELARVTENGPREITPLNLKEIFEKDIASPILKEWDILIIYSEVDVRPQAYAEINGAVHYPGQYALTPEMCISDLIFKSGQTTYTADLYSVELLRVSPSRQITLQKINYDELKRDKARDILLQDGDIVFVRENSSIVNLRIVDLTGEVNVPGKYVVTGGERLSSLLKRAGGLTNNAFLDGAIFTRESLRKSQREMFERFVRDETVAILQEETMIGLQALTESLLTNRKAVLEGRKEMLKYISTLVPKGRMVVRLNAPERLQDTKDDILLENGDSIFIPQFPSTVQVIGSVNNPSSLVFEANKGVDYYIKKSGGYTRYADAGESYVIKANGEADKYFARVKKIDRGDTIVVPQRLRYLPNPYGVFKDTLQILSQAAVGVGVVAALQR